MLALKFQLCYDKLQKINMKQSPVLSPPQYLYYSIYNILYNIHNSIIRYLNNSIIYIGYYYSTYTYMHTYILILKQEISLFILWMISTNVKSGSTNKGKELRLILIGGLYVSTRFYFQDSGRYHNWIRMYLCHLPSILK